MPVLPRGNSQACNKQAPKQPPTEHLTPATRTPTITPPRSVGPRGRLFQPDPRNPTALAMTALISRARHDGPSYIFFAALLGATFLV